MNDETTDAPCRISGIGDILDSCAAPSCPRDAWATITAPEHEGEAATVREVGVLIRRESIRDEVERAGARVSAADLDAVAVGCAAALSEYAAGVEWIAVQLLTARAKGELPDNARGDLDTLAKLAHRNAEQNVPAALAAARMLHRVAGGDEPNAVAETRAEIMIGRALVTATSAAEPTAYAALVSALVKGAAGAVYAARRAEGREKGGAE